MRTRSPRPEMLVDTAWLMANLDNPKVRIVDVTATLQAQPVGPSRVLDGRQDWEKSHIPGAAYLHMLEDLSAPQSGLPYNLPSAERMTEVLSSIGVDDDTTVVLYGGSYFPAITRAWWVMSASGLKDVRILNGGWKQWLADGRPVSSERPEFHKGSFRAQQVESLLADRQDVGAAIDDASTAIVNALSPEQFAGTGGSHYGRAGRIPGSINVPTRDLFGKYSSMLAPYDKLEAMMSAAGLFERERVIAYCGGGIAASTTVFTLTMLGHPEVRLYDRSLLEWSNQPELPMITG